MPSGLLEVQKVSTGWRKPLHIEGIVIKDGTKKLVPVVQIEKVTTSKNLIDMIKGILHLERGQNERDGI